jgi:hypothetical protein
MKRLTRRRFLGWTATGAIGTAVPGCVHLGEWGAKVSAPVKVLALGDMHILDNATAGYPRKVIQAMNE